MFGDRCFVLEDKAPDASLAMSIVVAWFAKYDSGIFNRR